MFGSLLLTFASPARSLRRGAVIRLGISYLASVACVFRSNSYSAQYTSAHRAMSRTHTCLDACELSAHSRSCRSGVGRLREAERLRRLLRHQVIPLVPGGQDACRVADMLIVLLELTSRVQQLTKACEVSLLLGTSTAPRHLLCAALRGIDLLDTTREVDRVAREVDIGTAL